MRVSILVFTNAGMLVTGAITSFSQLNSSLTNLLNSPLSFGASYTSLVSAIQPSPAPTSEAAVANALSSLSQSYGNNPLAAGAALLLSGLTNGITPSNSQTSDLDYFGACNGFNNTNTAEPDRTIYPKASPSDAPYDIPENLLRSAMYFPPTYTHGQKPPVLFIPGTGVESCMDFAPNLGKLLTASGLGDPVYVNVPGQMLDDEQGNAEFVAYAIQYLSATTGNQNVSIVSWSGGGPATQWAFKYWPSTRKYVTDFFAVSPDYQGTTEVALICPPLTTCTQSVLQQSRPSKWLKALRSNGGDSAYVPTTTVHNIFDEIVEPQQDPNASAHINDARGVGVTNVQIQDYCPPGTLAGGPNFGHGNALYNPVTAVLLYDALKNPGPANVERVKSQFQCERLMAEGLELEDVFASEALALIAPFDIVTHQPRTLVEPAIKSYAA